MANRKCALFWGDTGTGKTYSVFEAYPDAYTTFCIKNPWFDGYNDQRCALLDECGPGMMSHNFLKRLTDVYPMTVPVKGGSTAWNPEVVVLTSNVCIDIWFPGITEEDLKALKRRLCIFSFPEEKDEALHWIKSTSICKRERSEVIDVESMSD